jgi:hypothetical protein
MDINAFAAFFGGIGAGSVITSLIQHFLARKAQKAEYLQKERNQAYTDLLKSLEVLTVIDNFENAKRFGFCAARAEILASDDVNQALHLFRLTEKNSSARDDAFKRLLVAMRSDLVENS